MTEPTTTPAARPSRSDAQSMTTGLIRLLGVVQAARDVRDDLLSAEVNWAGRAELVLGLTWPLEEATRFAASVGAVHAVAGQPFTTQFLGKGREQERIAYRWHDNGSGDPHDAHLTLRLQVVVGPAPESTEAEQGPEADQ